MSPWTNPYTEALLPTPRAIVSNRARDSTGARANALVDLRIVKKPSANIIPDSLQLKGHNRDTLLLALLEPSDRMCPVSCSYRPHSVSRVEGFSELYRANFTGCGESLFFDGASFIPYIHRIITCMLARSVCRLTHVVAGKSMDAYV